jgi:ureidoglycolate dehydrogenase (NAD+)
LEKKPSTLQYTIGAQELSDFCIAALLKCGLREADARTTAEVLVTTDTWGIFTHGTKQLVNYVKRIRAEGMPPQATPKVTSDGPAWAIVDGQQAMAMVSSCMAMKLAIEKARAVGIGYVGVQNSTHFGAAGYYTNMAVKEDMIGLAMSNADPNMTAPGAKFRILGNNPFSYAAPAGTEKPIMLDIAMSTVAAGKINAAQAKGEKIPDTWLADQDGLPTTDPSVYEYSGALLPFGGHKGYGLAVMVEVLGAVLTGAGVTTEVKSWGLKAGEPTGTGHAFIAINVAAMMPIAQFKERMDTMIRGIRESPKAKGSNRIYLPGEMEWERREQALKNGIQLPEDVVANLQKLAEETGVALPASK